jgi:hypothetical protein
MTNEVNTDMDTGTIEDAEPMRILRSSTVSSLSGRSELTYHVGCDDHNAIHFRLWGNTGAGMFSNTWFSMKDVSEHLSVPDGFTSGALQPLWDSTSKNNAGFTLAILMGEGLIERSVSKPGTYTTANPAPFLARVNTLIAAGVDLDPADELDSSQPDIAPVVPKRGRPKTAKANTVST